MRRLFLFLLVVSAASAAVGAAAAQAPAAIRDASAVSDPDVELAGRHGTIVLNGRRYPRLVISGHRQRWLTVVASRRTSAGQVRILNTEKVRIVGLTIRPVGRHAKLEVLGARSIVLDRVRFLGGAGLHAKASIRSARNVRITRATFTRCGESKPPVAGYCVRLRDTRGVQILGSRFTDCFGCDFVHGLNNARLTIRTSSFHRARVGACGPRFDCNHQDILHLRAGGNVVIDRNEFGIQQWPGAAQIFANGAMRGLRVTNNVFLGADPTMPGVGVRRAMMIGNRIESDLPRNVFIGNNTILSGVPATLIREERPTATSIFFPHSYEGIPLRARPVVVNNVIKLLRTPGRMCPFPRIVRRNVVVDGTGCSRADVVGDPRLDARGRPTAESTLLIGRADERLATRVDFHGRLRVDPDIGAFEYPAP